MKYTNNALQHTNDPAPVLHADETPRPRHRIPRLRPRGLHRIPHVDARRRPLRGEHRCPAVSSDSSPECWCATATPVTHTLQRAAHAWCGAHLLRRLTIAQDSGAAIQGPARGDVFFGGSAQAADWAGRMVSEGRAIVLVPNKG